jgi:hypothetical protein
MIRKDGKVLRLGSDPSVEKNWETCKVTTHACKRHSHPANANKMPEFDEQNEKDDLDENQAVLFAEYTKPSYQFKRVNYHYSCPECEIPFEPVKTEEEMDAQVSLHDCENLTDYEMYKKRKIIKSKMGYSAWYDAVSFKPEHEQCVSYQTACTECAEKHELKLYQFYTFNELSSLVRPDSLFYKPSNSEWGLFPSIPQSWQYLRNKSGTQLELERKGINFGDHYDENKGVCKICGGTDSDMYCMNCWHPAGYLYDEKDR